MTASSVNFYEMFLPTLWFQIANKQINRKRRRSRGTRRKKMSCFLDKPITDKHNKRGEGNGLRFAVSTMQGWRAQMEDTYSAFIGLGEGLEDWSFFAVFDGHAGSTVSTMCAEFLLYFILKNFKLQASISEAIRTGFLELDTRLRELPDLASGKDRAGSTAVCALISPCNIYVANCGDSRALICSGKSLFATQDHRPFFHAERKRILEAGGTVTLLRINGSLAVSRSLGDFEFKKVSGKGPCEQLVSPEPDIHVLRRGKKDKFLVLACDGVWDVMYSEDVCYYVKYLMSVYDDLQNIANHLIETCLNKGSSDNISAIIVAFPGALTQNHRIAKIDHKVNMQIKQRVRELMTCEIPCKSWNELTYNLYKDKIRHLPPGGGLNAKYPLIQSVYNEYSPERDKGIQEEDNL